METLSSSLTTTTFQFPKQSKPNNHPQLNPPFSHHHHHHHNHPSTTSSLSTLHQKDTFTPLNLHYTKKSILSPHPPPPPPRAHVHRRAASGYAAALLDVSQSNGSVLKVERDVRRLLKVMRNDHVREFMMDEVVEEGEKGKVVKELLEKGKFDKNFVGLVKLVVDKGKKIDLVNDVLEEFLKVFSQLSVNYNNKNKLVMGNP
ncbi:uncharacterized protein LOC141596856 [Silene latifolia]|uniref:uncharacterized protein LOC141596856 n=1 Tax=Silene latifolia TaxID=37657 RepID=UPI003D76F46A